MLDYTELPKYNQFLIVDNYCPKRTKVRRCGGKREVIKDYFFNLLEIGVVIRGNEDTYASPVTCTKER